MIDDLTLLAVELAGREHRSKVTYRRYTVAEHAVILSTYVEPRFALLAMFADAVRLGLVPEIDQRPGDLDAMVADAEARLARDESGIAFLPPTHAAHIYLSRLMELHA